MGSWRSPWGATASVATSSTRGSDEWLGELESARGASARLEAPREAGVGAGEGPVRVAIAGRDPVQAPGGRRRPPGAPAQPRHRRPPAPLPGPPRPEDGPGVARREDRCGAQGRAQTPGRPAGRLVDWPRHTYDEGDVMPTDHYLGDGANPGADLAHGEG